MLLKVLFLVMLLSLPAGGWAESSSAWTLKDCYLKALKQSEQLALRQEAIKEAEAKFLRSLSGILPHVSYQLSDRRQDGSDSGNFTLKEIPERKFVFSQPIFSGFKEFAAMSASRSQTRQRRYEKRRAQEILFVDVVDAVYLFLSYQKDIEALSRSHQALVDRVKELTARQQLGRSRAGEVASARARLSRTAADLEEVRGQGEVARQFLEFLIGDKVLAVVDEGLPFAEVGLKENYLAQASGRSDALAAAEGWQAARGQVEVARAGFFPEVTMDGNYYQKRVGNSSGVDWEATLTVAVPLFEGGENMGALKEARAIAKQEEWKYQELKRRVELEAESAFVNFETARRKEEALRSAYQAAEENYQLQVEDYRKSLVNNLDVLQALEDVQAMRRAWDRAQYESKRLYWNLKFTAGDLDDIIGSID